MSDKNYPLNSANQPDTESEAEVVEATVQEAYEPTEYVAYETETTVDETVFNNNAEQATNPTTETSREPWYRKIANSAGATVAVAVGALVVVGLTVGLSAYAGTQAASAWHGHNKATLEQHATPHDFEDADDTDREYGRDFERPNRDSEDNDYGFNQDGPDGNYNSDDFDGNSRSDRFSQDGDPRDGNRENRSFDKDNGITDDSTTDENAQNNRDNRGEGLGEGQKTPENGELPQMPGNEGTSA